MNKAFLITIISLFLWKPTFSQFDNQHHFYINPIHILAFNNSSLDVGYLIRTGDYFSQELELGFILDIDPWSNEMRSLARRQDNKGFEIRYSPRLHYKNVYVGLQGAHTRHRYLSLRETSLQNRSIHTYQVQNSELSTYLSIGIIRTLGNQYFDFSLSSGYRYLQITNDSTIKVSELSPLHRFSDLIEREENGFHRVFGLRISLKIGLCFSKKNPFKFN